jgi:tape measure domain-containing protein
MAMDNVEKNIHEAEAAQQQLNNQMRNGQSAADALAGKVKKVVTTIATAVGINKIIGLSDTVAQTTARLNLMNDGMQTTAQLNQMIYQSAQRARSAYLDTAAVVSKLGILAGDAFSSNKEITFFAEQMNKQFKIGGASIQEQTAGMYQLTQAMASGRLQGDEFRSIIENAPMLAQAIAKYTGKSMGDLRELSKEGLITADVIKNAMFAATEETNAKFASMPKTFGQVVTFIKNQATMAFMPVLQRINEIANSDRFNRLVDNVVGGLVVASHLAITTFNILASGINFVADHWAIIRPVVLGVAAAYIVYNGTALITNGILAAQTFLTGLATFKTQAHAAALMMQKSATLAATGALVMQRGATFTATVAQYGLNAALYACPITWIIGAIIILISIFYVAIAVVNKFAGTSLSATGMIVGAFFQVGALLGNIVIAANNLVIDSFALIWNYIIGFAEFFANVFNDPIGSVVRRFADMADAILGIIAGVARAIDTLFGSHTAKAVEGWRNSLKNVVRDNFGEATVKFQRMDPEAYRLKRLNYGEAYDTGYSFGNKLANVFNPNNMQLTQNSDKSAADLARELMSQVSNTAGNTKDIKDSLDISTEDLKYLRDIAEQEVINRFTTAEIKVDMTNYNSVNNEMDLDGMTTYLKDRLETDMQSAAEGVHD